MVLWQSFLLLCLSNVGVSGFSLSKSTPRVSSALKGHKQPGFQNAVTAAIVAGTLSVSSLVSPVCAYDDSDYASETVTAAVQSLRTAGSDAQATLKSYKDIAEIITEGKGVGGSINYEGVQLNRGYVADEDTSIYNPGLTLLTESEKERLVEAVIGARKAGLSANSWTQDNQAGYEFLKEKLDPLHMVELKGYLGILPFYGAFLYLAALGVQQFARGLFPIAYLVGVALVFGPILALVAAGPQ